MKSLAITGTVILACGCKQHKYEFDGMIGNEHVKFHSKENCGIPLDPLGPCNVLTVNKKDGKTIVYSDNLSNDLKLEYIKIIRDGEPTFYEGNFLDTAQKQFDSYLTKIDSVKNGVKN